MNMINNNGRGGGVMVGYDALLTDWLEGCPDTALRDAHVEAVEALTELRREERFARSRDGAEERSLRIADAMVELAAVIDRAVAFYGDRRQRRSGRLQTAARNAAWLRDEAAARRAGERTLAQIATAVTS